MARTFSFPPRGRESSKPRGFSLVEIMVALVIGMIGVLVIMQVARTAEAQKRVTTGSGDAQSNAALALYSIERDLKQAGYGFSSLNVIGCPLTIPEHDSLPAHTLNFLAPVTINGGVPAGDIGTDTLLVVYGSGAGAPEGDLIVSPAVAISNQRHIGVRSSKNYLPGEWVVAAPPIPVSDCERTMSPISVIDPPGLGVENVIEFASGEADAVDGAQADWLLFDFGVAPRIVGYAIRDGDLTACDYMLKNCADGGAIEANWEIIANGIVGLRAQYGRAVDAWDQVTPVLVPGGSQEAFAKALAGISAVRLALLSRNSEPDREEVTTTAPSWSGDADLELIDLSGDAEKHYRYQVYETIVPLRNIPWMGL
jgi:type IV pilus assembly protein PilW